MPIPSNPALIDITSLGHQGDGIGDWQGKPVYVPATLPGEQVEVTFRDGKPHLQAIVTASPHRVKPKCRFAKSCGGCVAQHMQQDHYQNWKTAIAATACQHHGFTPPLAPIADAHGLGRRRVILHANRKIAGFMGRRSHDLIAIDHCPLLVPALQSAPEIARAIGAIAASKKTPAAIQFTAADNGIDCNIIPPDMVKIDLARRQALAEIMGQFDLARISFAGDIIAERQSPIIDIAGTAVALSPGGFLQATKAGETLIASHAIDALKNCRHVADLFSGSGPFTFHQAHLCKVTAIDNAVDAIANLQQAARLSSGLKSITTQCRDLFSDPLTSVELNHFDGVIVDPPRAGAQLQMQQLALSNVPKVVSVSCNPASFARDAQILRQGGYQLLSLYPIDQFKWSNHLELVGIFNKA